MNRMLLSNLFSKSKNTPKSLVECRGNQFRPRHFLNEPIHSRISTVACQNEEQVLTREMGGEIYELISKFEGREFTCIGHCPSECIRIGTWYGYPHDRGLSDANGSRWWAYQKCEVSGYKTAWWKVERLLSTRTKDKQVRDSGKLGDQFDERIKKIEDSKYYYHLLCVDTNASSEQIKKNYRYLVRRFHPDSQNDECESDLEVMKSINEAYDILSNPESRSKYDSAGFRLRERKK